MTGDEDEMVAERGAFITWLLENGAKFDNIDWPSNQTASGIRGAIAREEILSNELMLEIPLRLMMCEVHAFEDEDIGIFLKDQVSVNGVLLLSLYVMHELRKGRQSFYSPYLKILPQPEPLAEWEDIELDTLQVSSSLTNILTTCHICNE